MRQRTLILGIAMSSIISGAAHAQSLNTQWKQELNSSLEKFMACQSGPREEGSECNFYTGKSLQTVYKLNDFYSEKSGRYMTVKEIGKFLRESGNWTELGRSYDQKILETAQEYANARKAVVALYQNSEGLGHLVVITPGTLQMSGSWGLKVPSAASFFAIDPSKSFIDKAMSFAFAKNMIKDVVIYARNY